MAADRDRLSDAARLAAATPLLPALLLGACGVETGAPAGLGLSPPAALASARAVASICCSPPESVAAR